MNDIYAVFKAMTLGAFDGSKPLSQDINGSDALAMAILRGNNEAVKFLLGAGVDPNAASKLGPSPLHIAAGYGRIEAIAMLIEKGANPCIAYETMTPILVAAQTGQHACVVYLMALGIRFQQDPTLAEQLAKEDQMFKDMEAKIMANEVLVDVTPPAIASD